MMLPLAAVIVPARSPAAMTLAIDPVADRTPLVVMSPIVTPSQSYGLPDVLFGLGFQAIDLDREILLTECFRIQQRLNFGRHRRLPRRFVTGRDNLQGVPRGRLVVSGHSS